MIVYLWEACGPGRFGGISDDGARARRAAERCIDSGQAATARVEIACFSPGLWSVPARYERTGRGWAAQRRDGGVAWEPFTLPWQVAS